MQATSLWWALPVVPFPGRPIWETVTPTYVNMTAMGMSFGHDSSAAKAWDMANGMAMDRTGNVYVVGFTLGL